MRKCRSLASLGMTIAALALVASCDSTKPKPAVSITSVPGTNGRTGDVGTAVDIAPKVKALDEDLGGVAGVTITWNVTVGGGSVATATSTTGDDGTATPGSWTLGTIAGTNAMTASAAGIEKTLTFLATGEAGAPAIIAIQGGSNQTSAAGSPVPIAPSVRVTDVYGNAVSGVMVTFSVTAGGGSLLGATPTTNANGIAVVGKWTLGPASGIHTLTATISGVSPTNINATATAPPTQLVINTEPAGVVDGEVFDTQPVISVRDAANGTVTSSTAFVTASIASGTGTLTGTTSVNAVNGIATFTNLAVSGNSAVTLKFSATNLTAATSTSFTPSVPPPLNLTIDRVHLNQAAQTYSGGVPIVAGRPALARVFVKSNVTNTSMPAVRLRTFVNGAPFKTYNIPAPGSPTKLIDDSVLGKSWNVLIPADEVVTGMSVLADVDVAGTVTESDDADNSYPLSGTALPLDVRQVNTMKVTFVPVSQPNGVVAGNVTEANKMAAMDYAMRVYPFDTADVIVHAPYAYSATLNGTSYDNTWQTLLSNINAMRTAEGILDRYYYGLAHPAYSSGVTGLGYIGTPAAIGMDFTNSVQPGTDYYRMTIAHEWGHNFGRQHINCGNPQGTDAGFPYDALTTIGTHGYDLQFGLLRKSTDFREFMSYCQPLWTSDYTYKAVLEYRGTHPGPQVAAKQNVLLVWGRVGPEGVVLEPAYEIEAPISLPTESGPYLVQGLDEGGRSMFTISFAGAEIDHVAGVRAFAYAVPLPASGARPATLRLLEGTRELAKRSRIVSPTGRGANLSVVAAPTRLTQVNGSRSRLEWDATAYPGAMVRDPATGQVLAFLSGGSGEIGVARDVDVVLSTGVSSVRQRVVIIPK